MPSFIDYYNYSFEELINLIESENSQSKKRVLNDYDIKKVLKGFKARGVKDLKYLLKRIRKNTGLRHYSFELKLSEEYLEELRRQLSSYVPKAKPLKALLPVRSKVQEEWINKLKSLGMTNTYHILHIGKTIIGRAQLAKMTEIHVDFIKELVQYADILRCGVVNNTWARMYIENNIDTAQKLQSSSPKELYDLFKGINKKYGKLKKDPSIEGLRSNIVEASRAIKRLEVEY
ncbi:MAG: DUF4332 domain-containing protein [Candidatus Kariarchaeaceae archaeon]|jgi:hypothetical protein